MQEKRRGSMKIKTSVILLTLICLAFISASCSTVGSEKDPRIIDTSIALNRNNFRMIKAAAQGKDGGFALLGIIPFARVSEGDAIANLYKTVNVEGKATSLINVHRDYSLRYFILFSLPQTKITADVIEFIDENNTQK